MRLLVGALLLSACDASTPLPGALSGPPAAAYQVRIAEATIGANGHTKREVFAFGRTASGEPAVDDVVLSVQPPTAGSFVTTKLTLGALGARTYFVPCAEASTGCLGTATVTVSLASDPSVPIATTSIELVSPTHISSAAPCLVPRTNAFLDGNDFIRNGTLPIDRVADKHFYYPSAQQISVDVTPARLIQGGYWDFTVNSTQLNAPLAVGVYLDAMRAPFTTQGHPGLEVTGNGHGCNTITGAFEIHEISSTGVLLSFEQHCDGVGTLEGCVRYAP